MRLRPLLRRVHERVGEPKIERYLYFETPTIEGLLKLANCMDETHVYCISVYQSNVGRSIGMNRSDLYNYIYIYILANRHRYE